MFSLPTKQVFTLKVVPVFYSEQKYFTCAGAFLGVFFIIVLLFLGVFYLFTAMLLCRHKVKFVASVLPSVCH